MSDTAGEAQAAEETGEGAAPAELTVPQAVQLAVGLQQKGFVEAAAEIYRRVLAAVPDHVDALHFLGVCLRLLGQADEGLRLVERAVAEAPDHVDARNSLGNIYLERGRLEEARAAYQQVVAQRPEFAAAHANLGVVFQRLEDKAGAEAAFRRALAVDPHYASALHNLGSLLWDEDKMDEALTCFREALTLMPYDGDSYRRLGATLSAMGRKEEAIPVYQRWMELEPDHPLAPHMLAACLGENVPTRASDSFVEYTFDSFAGSFDKVLARLEYRAPALVAEAVAAAVGAPAGTLDVLDVGAGTGLCGPLLRGYARRLVGIDLSKGMLDKARERDCYDALEVAELTAYLREHARSYGRGPARPYDLIVSADTLCYFGDLTDALAAAAGAMQPGGRLIFTVEHLTDAPAAASASGFFLNPHGRYSHREEYVRDRLTAAGLTPVSFERAVLRTENKRPVDGLVVTAMRAAAAG
jgi:predicted TPR repeat methyltransferase